jgi:hypothetical protein
VSKCMWKFSLKLLVVYLWKAGIFINMQHWLFLSHVTAKLFWNFAFRLYCGSALKTNLFNDRTS